MSSDQVPTQDLSVVVPVLDDPRFALLRPPGGHRTSFIVTDILCDSLCNFSFSKK